MGRSGFRAVSWPIIGIVLGALLIVTACAGGAATRHKAGGGVVTFAETPGITPNYILPLAGADYFTIVNIPQFSQDIYLPLYWFGNKQGQPVLNTSLSIANPPIFADGNRQVTITLKHWQWSNGAPITARDVMFWMNLLSAVTDPNAPLIGSSSAPGPGWGAEVPGGFPTNVVSYAQTGTYSITFKLNASYNPTWYTYNELSQIDPMPQASWDKLSATGSVGQYDVSAEVRTALPNTSPPQYVPESPGSATAGALGVAQFLNTQSQDITTYATNPLWKVVDGPFELSQFTPTGYVKMIPNRAYSGSPKPKISAFEELPFTTDSAEFEALRSGSVTIGYVPPQDVNEISALEKSQNYRFSPWEQFGIVDMKYNFTNTTTGPLVRQLYFRQAFQSLVNQAQYVKEFSGGIGSPGVGPVPTYPKGNPDVSLLEAKGQVYPYDPARAVSLLKDNGWTVQPGGTSYCSRPGTGTGQCGAGVRAGQQAAFQVLYASGSVQLTNEMEAMQSTMRSKAGIDLTLHEESFALVFGTALNNCSPATPCNDWQMADWGSNVSWVYAPDYFPTGGELFTTGAGSNGGDFSSVTNDANILATHTAPTHAAEMAALFRYEDYLARELPVIWMPNSPYQLTLYKSNLRDFVPQGIYDEVYPQYYSLDG